MSQSRKILLLGAGGHCISVLDSLIELDQYEDIAIIDKVNDTSNILGFLVIGNDDDLEHLYEEGYTYAFITVGSLGETSIRRKLYKKLKDIGYNIPNIIDNSSIVSKFASVGEGNYIGKNVVINVGTSIGNCTIINTSSTIEHECTINDFVHISPGSILCGNVTIEADTHIGAASVIRQGLSIGSNTIIGLGSVVVANIGSNATAYGNPCKEVKHE